MAKYLLDARGGGDQYDQSHVPVTRQYEAVGHAVRAVYSYSGMTDIAMATGDVDYHSAVKSLCNSIVNRKYYVTGGVGSGETSEGFGKDYSCPTTPTASRARVAVSCSSSASSTRLPRRRHADLAEETLYNAILGSVDLEGENFTYTNSLDSAERRYPGTVALLCRQYPRTLLSLPTWMYAKTADTLYVNLFIGSEVTVENVAGTRVQLVQTTDYPWNGKVSLVVNPAAPRRFSVMIRVPNRGVSQLYTATPDGNGITSLAVNGAAVTPTIEQGYAVLTRDWKAATRSTPSFRW